MENINTGQAIVFVILSVFYTNISLEGTNMYARQRPGMLSDQIQDIYDYVIVGGGTAGCVLAARLSENRNNRVLLLEAGGFYDEIPNLPVLANVENVRKSVNMWAHHTTSQKQALFGMVENKAYWPRGRVLGGNNVLSDGLYVRGNRDDYNDWAKELGDDWSYRQVLPYFLKSEYVKSDTLEGSKYHTMVGQMAVSEGGSTPLADSFLVAGKELGYNITDYNGDSSQGFSKPQLNSRKGIRETTATSILARIRARRNLSVVVNAFVTSIALKDKHAVGVHYTVDGKTRFVKAAKEVILSAGAIKTPHVLMLSGIGPKDHLEEMNIPVIADLPVGENLQDHLAIPLFSKVNKGMAFYSEDDLSSHWSKLQYRMFGSGPLSQSVKEGIAFLSTTGSSVNQAPDIQATLSRMILPMDNFNYKSDIVRELTEKFPTSDGFTFQLAITRPSSKGYLKLQNTDPFDQPLMNPQYLVSDSDITNFIAGIRIWEKFITTPTMKSIGADVNQMKTSFCERHHFQSDEFWDCMVRHLATTTHDISCTCKMGSSNDPQSVVNARFEVHGIKGLRVVDASVFPNIPSGNINAPIVMIAEKAADLIQGIDSVKTIRQNLPENI